MAKKYLSLEEAAHQLGMTPEALNRVREKGDLRGFADRGTWKFKGEDVEEYSRSKTADSSPEVPILDDDDLSVTDSGVVAGSPGDGPGSSVIVGDDSESDVLADVGEQPTMIRGSGASDRMKASDSDVRLILDEQLTQGDDSDPSVAAMADSDSNVRMLGEDQQDEDSDSDVSLVGTDSDSNVRLIGSEEAKPKAGTDSDSDVRIAGDDGTDSDVALLPSDSGIPVGLGDESSAKIVPDKPRPKPGSGVRREPIQDSGITLGGRDSGVALEPDDSSVLLGGLDSGISLGPSDSGIALESVDDSGLSLSDGSGIVLRNLDDDSGIALEPDDKTEELNQTIPMLDADADEDDSNDTRMEFPGLEDSEFELADNQDTQADDIAASVLFLDEGPDAGDEHGRTVVKKRRADSDELVEFAAAEGAEFDAVEVSESVEFEQADDLEVADAVLDEDDEIDDLDVFDAGDDVFDDAFQTGESRADFGMPGMGPQVMVAPEPEWGTGTFIGLLASTMLMLLVGFMMIDLIQGMWGWNDQQVYSSFLLETLGGLF
ncbi:MAG: hypothetical protein ACREJB_15560 [Planctomycetaceae bacterium]